MEENIPSVSGSLSVPDGILGYLVGMIRRGEIAPGDQLPPERQLAEALGASRVSLRAAIKQLQETGYVEVRRGKLGGTFVTSLKRPVSEWRAHMREAAGELEDILAFRIAVECHAATLAAAHRTAEDLEAMQSAIEEQFTAASHAQFRASDSMFHELVSKASGSRRLSKAARDARGEFFSPADMLVYRDPVEEDRLQHQAIFEAIRDGEGERAALAMKFHIENTYSLLLAALAEPED